MSAPTFQDVIQTLNRYWAEQGCVLVQPLDTEVGAGTFHPMTFLRSLGPEPWAAAYVQPCRRPTDGRYGDNPIEMVSPELNQMQVQASIDLDFAAGVRTLLRQDPDIIMIGEIRDLETAQMAVQASLTGHLVLSTLHTNDSPSAVTRLLDLGVPHYLIQSTLTGVVAQRLVRTLCPHCKRAVAQDADEWRVITRGWDIPVPERVFEAVGCLECRKTGFLGRTGVYEMMAVSSRLRSIISSELDLGRFGDAALREGMKPLRISAAAQVAAGVTTVREVLNVLPPGDIDDSIHP